MSDMSFKAFTTAFKAGRLSKSQVLAARLLMVTVAMPSLMDTTTLSLGLIVIE
jgi:hypothetical protein